MRQLISIDIETGGLDLDADILSFCARVLKPDGSPTSTMFYRHIRPTKKPNKEALLINRLDYSALKKAPKKQQVVKEFHEWLFTLSEGKQSTPVGHNYAGFDGPRIQKFLPFDMYKKLFHYHAIDTMVLAKALVQAGILDVRSVSLKGLIEYFCLKVPGDKNRHAADVDTYMTGLVLNRLLKVTYPDVITRIIRVFNPKYLGVEINKDINR